MIQGSQTDGLLHDLNNLLTAIAGVADAVLERSNLDREIRADIESIREGARRGTTMGLHTADTRPAPPEPVSLNQTVHAMAPLLRRHLGRDLTLNLALDDLDSLVWADAASLDRVLLNLVTNARHATGAGGIVTIRTSTRAVTDAEAHVPDTIPPGVYAVVSVADTGSGIPASQLPSIFEPGVTSRAESGGSGLGLASVRSILHEHGGFVSVESSAGLGSCFSIYLRRVPGTILLVDDDGLVRSVAERLLRRAGWRVLPALSAEDACRILEQDRCDIIISDVSMPGMSGVALARHARTRQPGLPVILTSGYTRTLDRDPMLDGVRFLAKPYTGDDLCRMVASVMAGRESRQEGR